MTAAISSHCECGLPYSSTVLKTHDGTTILTVQCAPCGISFEKRDGTISQLVPRKCTVSPTELAGGFIAAGAFGEGA